MFKRLIRELYMKMFETEQLLETLQSESFKFESQFDAMNEMAVLFNILKLTVQTRFGSGINVKRMKM
jgi:hypothetical protein